MEPRPIAQRLVSAESQVQWGDARVSKQRTLVRHLERHGLGTFYARRLLKELEDTQACFVAYRDQLEFEMALSAVSPAGPPRGQGRAGKLCWSGDFSNAQGIAPKV
jgi:hypothetical protein